MLIKPPMWGVEPGLVAPEWRWFWRPGQSAYAVWEGAGLPRDLGGLSTSEVFNGSPNWVGSKAGRALDFVSSDSDSFAFTADLSDTGKVALYLYYLWDANADDNKLLGEYTDNSNSNNGFLINPNATADGGGNFAINVHETSPAKNNSVLFARPTAGVFHTLVWNFDPAIVGALNEHQIFIDGVEQSLSVNPAATGDHASSYTFDAASMHLFSRGLASLFGDGQIAAVSLWKDFNLSSVRVMQLAQDPPGPFRMVDEAGIVFAVAAVANPKGPFGMPLHGPFGGPI